MAISQRILSGSQTRGSSATNSGSIDRFRQGVSVLTSRQTLMGVSPKMSSLSSATKLINGRVIADDSQYFNEANEPPALRTIVGTTQSTNPLVSTIGRISYVPNHKVEQRDFGILKLFNYDVPFEDMAKFDAIVFLLDSGSMMYPNILDNVSIRNPFELNGIIEPLTIRAAVSLTSIEFPFEAHGTYGFLCNGAESSRRRSNPIVQQIDLEDTNFEPYQDGGARVFGSSAAAINIPGFLHNSFNMINPWKESSDVELETDKLLRSGSLINSTDGSYSDRSMVDALLQSTSSIDDLNDRHHKSATAGFIYINAEDGTDSLAFGGLKK